LLRDLVASIREKEAGQDIAIGCLDIGLAEEQLEWLRKHVYKIVRPNWDLNVPDYIRKNTILLSQAARPFIREYFPGYDIYLWIDADVWLQQWYCLEYYLHAANIADAGVTPHIDRSYLLPPQKVFRWRYGRLKQNYGEQAATFCIYRPYINAGIVAARDNSKIWQFWAEAIQLGINQGHMVCDQAALNYAVHMKKLEAELLPAVCNWQCHLALPKWDARTETFCEPFVPHLPIGFMHLTGTTKNNNYTILTLEGKMRRTSLRYKGSFLEETLSGADSLK
jgi:hypothetical protein